MPNTHDVSNEARDDHGRWTEGGGSGKKKSVKKKLSKFEKRARIVREAAKYAGTYGAIAGGLIYGVGKDEQKRTGKISSKAVYKKTAKYALGAAAVGAGLGAAKEYHSQKYEESPEYRKNVHRAVAGATAVGTGVLVKRALESKLHQKVQRKMEDAIRNEHANIAGGTRIKDLEMIRRFAYSSRDFANRGQPSPKHNKLLKQLHYHRQFIEQGHEYRQKVYHGIRKHLGIKTFRERAFDAAKSAVKRFRPLRTVKIAGLLK